MKGPNQHFRPSKGTGRPMCNYVKTQKPPKSMGAQPQGTMRSGPTDIGAHPAMPKG